MGSRFGRLQITSYAGVRGAHRYYNCRCDCGGRARTRGVLLRSGLTTSCGCLNEEKRVAAITKHGEAGRGRVSVEYTTWCSMVGRCTNPNNPRFKDWGGRGIKVCKRWRNSYKNFLEDMGRRPSKDHSLDRKDNDGNYTPTNCRWATRLMQMQNRRKKQELQ